MNISTLLSVLIGFLRFWAIFLPLIFVPFLLTTLYTGNILGKVQQNPHYSTTHLTDIVNPIAWKGYLEIIAYTHTFRNGLCTKNPQQLSRYLNWSLKFLRHKPRIELYEHSLLALKTLNKTTAYNKLLAEAKQTYPQKKSWQVTDLTE